jgi:hypothetical protein
MVPKWDVGDDLMTMTKGGIKVSTGVKAGGARNQHNRKPTGVRVRAGVKAGIILIQHNRKVRRA